LLVEGKEELDAFAVGSKGFGAVAAFNGTVELLMGLGEFRWHEERIVELGEGRVGVEGAGVKDGLGEFFDSGFLGGCGVRPGIIVIDQAI